MTSILSGIARTLSGDNTAPRSAHAVFVEAQLIPAVQRLQKELGWARRYKVRVVVVLCCVFFVLFCLRACVCFGCIAAVNSEPYLTLSLTLVCLFNCFFLINRNAKRRCRKPCCS